MACPTCSESGQISSVGPGQFACAMCGTRWSTGDAPPPEEPARLAVLPAAETEPDEAALDLAELKDQIRDAIADHEDRIAVLEARMDLYAEEPEPEA